MFGFHADELKVLLLKWNNIDWSLPRGRIYKEELIADAASRVLKETTGIHDVFLQQFHTFGAAQRHKNYTDDQAARLFDNKSKESREYELVHESIVSIGYYALVDFEKVVPNLAASYQWCEIPAIPDLLFDHNDMIELALVALRKDLRYLPIANLLPPKFTLREMQKLYETILNRTFDRRNFHKLLMSYDFLIKLPEKRVGTANKSPHLYQIDFEKYELALQDGISY
ncbi:NUDIX hydrolase [Chryseolinea sp. Jin1]|uniref:NUDIX hydrolase n=2 Tax=Chryseolinea lacunae TaxID=2801331 RepID=A0ABS1KK77_9BACT|nr:NUDIX hydrolase [Chryseolinea lacunae]